MNPVKTKKKLTIDAKALQQKLNEFEWWFREAVRKNFFYMFKTATYFYHEDNCEIKLDLRNELKVCDASFRNLCELSSPTFKGCKLYAKFVNETVEIKTNKRQDNYVDRVVLKKIVKINEIRIENKTDKKEITVSLKKTYKKLINKVLQVLDKKAHISSIVLREIKLSLQGIKTKIGYDKINEKKSFLTNTVEYINRKMSELRNKHHARYLIRKQHSFIFEKIHFVSVDGPCSFCHEPFRVGKQATALRCYHIFCTSCTLDWFCKSESCPTCGNNSKYKPDILSIH